MATHTHGSADATSSQLRCEYSPPSNFAPRISLVACATACLPSAGFLFGLLSLTLR
jgi:hypothetical protein